MFSAKAVDAATLIRIFHARFYASHHTVLSGGADEPLYLPATADMPSTLFFRRDYVSSALHEVSHWCIAGPGRRGQRDYGYWYEPDGRSSNSQQRFLQVEALPQALEWCFSQACAQPFRLSLDNLDGSVDARQQRDFADAVQDVVDRLKTQGLPPRAQLFFEDLRGHFQGCGPLPGMRFTPQAFQ